MALYDRVATNETPTKWQKKALTADDVNPGTVNLPGLSFSGLTIGKTYRASYSIPTLFTATDSGSFLVNCGGSLVEHFVGGDVDDAQVWSTSIVFTAAGTTLDLDVSSFVNITIQGDANEDESQVFLEELPNHSETTDFT